MTDSEKVRSFLGRPSYKVAPELLGWRLVHATPDGTIAVEITEVEAYSGGADPASHAYRGRTTRNAVMFGPAGGLYVYRSYGIHWCANITTGAEGTASAVLLRAGKIVEGVELARARRGAAVRDEALARGPGNFTQALGITGAHNGVDVSSSPSLCLCEPSAERPEPPISVGPRVGISRATAVEWRFWVQNEASVSAFRVGSQRRRKSRSRQ